MSRQPLSAADAITFLDKVDCEKCDFRGTESAVWQHNKDEHLVREKGERRNTTPYVEDPKRKLPYDPLITSSTQSVDSLSYEKVKEHYEKLVAQRVQEKEKAELAKQRKQKIKEAREKEERQRKELTEKYYDVVAKKYGPGEREYFISRIQMFEQGHISKERLIATLGDITDS